MSDMLTGRREPALGGDGTCVDVVGLNFYHDNQWEYPSGRKLAWHVAPRDARWRPLHRLLREVFERYGRPLYLTETSHVAMADAAWLHELSDESSRRRSTVVCQSSACASIRSSIATGGTTGRHWHNSGLWDLVLRPRREATSRS